MNKYGSLTGKRLFFGPGFLYCLLFCSLLPGYQFLVDSDATGYLYVAEQTAAGNLYHSINGVWSPLGSWILAPFIWLGIDGILAAKWLNGLYGLASLYLIHLLLRRHLLSQFAYYLLLAPATLLLLHFALSRLFADLLQVMLLLCYFCLITKPAFANNKRKIALAAATGAIGFYAKSYVLYFILLHLPVTLILLHYTQPVRPSLTSLLKKVSLAIVLLVLLCLPWAFAMQLKYNHFAFSNVGHYNITGGLLINHTQSAGVFFPPPNPGGYSIWDDPYHTFSLSMGKPDIGELLLRQTKIALSNTRDLLLTLLRFSWLLVPLFLCFAAAVKKRRSLHQYPAALPAGLLFIVIWCSGYVLLHIEDRFFWIVPLLCLVLTGNLSQWLFAKLSTTRSGMVTAAIAVSFCIYPATRLVKNYQSGKQSFEMAAAFKQRNIMGNLMSLQQDSDDMDKTVLLNYLLKSKYYGPIRNTYTQLQLEQAVEKFKINYVILFYHSAAAQKEMMAHPLVQHAAAVLSDVYPGVVVLRL